MNLPRGVTVSTTVSTVAKATAAVELDWEPDSVLRWTPGRINNEAGLVTYCWWRMLAWSHSSAAGQRKTRISGGTDFNTTPEPFPLNVFFSLFFFLIFFKKNLSFYLSPFHVFFALSLSRARQDKVPASVSFISPLPGESDRGEPCLFLFWLTDFLCAVNQTLFMKPPAQRRREQQN